jgi:hypothetical protein
MILILYNYIQSKRGEIKVKEESSILFGLHLPIEIVQPPEAAGFDHLKAKL